MCRRFYSDNFKRTECNTFLMLGRKKRLAMLDLLLTAEKNGLIDNEGIKEEVDTFTFEVSYTYMYCIGILHIATYI